MSFFGGGTDMPRFFKENGGAVFSTTFDKYCYANVRYSQILIEIFKVIYTNRGKQFDESRYNLSFI